MPTSSDSLDILEFDATRQSFMWRLKLAFLDIQNGILAAPLWLALGWQDIRQRYRRSVLGPFWLTISTAIMVCALGYVYSGLFKESLGKHLPYVAVGMTVWALIAAILNDACTTFTAAEGLLKQTRLPISVHIFRMVWRNLLIFAHNAVILLVVYLAFGDGLQANLLLLPLALLAIAVNGVWAGMLFGIFCTRFRDIGQIITNFIQLIFFVTPIVWRPDLLSARGWLADFNPFYHFIQIVRAPLLNEAFPVVSWAAVSGITIAGLSLGVLMLARFRHRVVYWI